jgi:hypothetical protein
MAGLSLWASASFPSVLRPPAARQIHVVHPHGEEPPAGGGGHPRAVPRAAGAQTAGHAAQVRAAKHSECVIPVLGDGGNNYLPINGGRGNSANGCFSENHMVWFELLKLPIEVWPKKL